MFSIHGPVIVNVIDNRRWDLHNSVLFFAIEFFKFCCLREDGFFGRRLLLALLFSILLWVFLLLRDGFTSVYPPLTIMILGVSLDRILVCFLPRELLVNEVVVTALLSILFLLNLRLAVFFGASSGNLAPRDVDLTA